MDTSDYEKFEALVKSLLAKYKQAWEKQDSDLVLTIFDREAVYHERVLANPMRGHDEIRKYWETKVVNGQSNIEFTLLELFLDLKRSTAIAEWQAEFNDTVQGTRKFMKEIAVLKIVNDLIVSLREYWACMQV